MPWQSVDCAAFLSENVLVAEFKTFDVKYNSSATIQSLTLFIGRELAGNSGTHREDKHTMKRNASAMLFLMTMLLFPMSSAVSAQTVDMHWREIGPGEGGWMYGVAISPHNPKTIVAGLDMGNGFITQDAGLHWTVLGRSGTIPLGQPGYRGFNCTAYDPNSASTIWVGSTHGIFKSTDSGLNWTLSRGGTPDDSIGAIQVDPDNSQVVYAASGQGVGGAPPWLHGQIWKTVDGGKTWAEAGRPGGDSDHDPIKSRGWHTLLVDKASRVIPNEGHSRIYVAGPGGLFVSHDAGHEWTSLEPNMPGGEANLNPAEPSHTTSSTADIALLQSVNQGAPSVLLLTERLRYADSTHSKILGGVFRSDDSGVTWVDQNGGLGDDERAIVEKGEPTYLLLSVCQSDQRRIYLASFRDVFGSVDTGQHWRRLTESAADWSPVSDSFGKQGSWNLSRRNTDGGGGSDYGICSLSVAPTDPSEVAFTGSAGVRITRDGGRIWASAMNDFGQAVHPNMFGDRPAMRQTHLQRGRGAQLIVARNLAVDPFNSANIAIGYDDLGLEISRDRANWWEWTWMGVGLGERDDADAVAFDPNHRGHIYLGCDDRPGPSRHIYESTDGGHTFQSIGLPALAAAADQGKHTFTDVLLVDGTKSTGGAIVYAGTSVGLFRTTNDGKSWQDVSGPMSGRAIHRFVQVPRSRGRFYAGIRDPGGSGNSGLYRTDDSGAHWTRLGADELGDIQSLSQCQSDPRVLVVVAGPVDGNGGSDWQPFRLWRSDDAGDHWRMIDNRRAAFAAVSPADPNTIYFSTWAKDVRTEITGFWVSRDAGKSWTDANKNLSLALTGQGDHIVFDPHDPRHLYMIQESGVYVGYDSQLPMRRTVGR